MKVVAINSAYKSWNGPSIKPAEWSTIADEFAHQRSHPQKIIRILKAPEIDLSAWSMWDHPRAPTYYDGRVVMLDDVAHASTPFPGQGSGQVIEDAYVLSSLFAVVDTKDKIPFAFRTYDTIRRPRSQMVCKTSHEAGELCALRLPGVDDNVAAFKEDISWRMDWMGHRDIAGEYLEALAIFNKLLL
jgi:salicylate hydroxylase